MICEQCRKAPVTHQVTHASPVRTIGYCDRCVQEDPFAPKQGRFLTGEALQKLEALGQELESLRQHIEKELQAEQ